MMSDARLACPEQRIRVAFGNTLLDDGGRRHGQGTGKTHVVSGNAMFRV